MTAKNGEFTYIFNVQFNDGFLRVLRGQSGLSEGFTWSEWAFLGFYVVRVGFPRVLRGQSGLSEGFTWSEWAF
jgi:hypothetical protein